MKPEYPMWNMFTILVCEMNGKNVAICKDCNSSVRAKSDRLHDHSKRCVPTRTPQKWPHEIETLVACMYSR